MTDEQRERIIAIGHTITEGANLRTYEACCSACGLDMH